MNFQHKIEFLGELIPVATCHHLTQMEEPPISLIDLNSHSFHNAEYIPKKKFRETIFFELQVIKK